MRKRLDRSVERRIIADRAKAGLTVVVVEVLAIIPKTLSCKGRLGVLLEVNLALPAFIGPGRGPESYERRKWHGPGFYRSRFRESAHCPEPTNSYKHPTGTKPLPKSFESAR